VDNLTNATAIGYSAQVAESNALVLGGTGANAVNVGIGTATPQFTLDVQGSGNFTGPVTFAAGQTFPGTGMGTVTSVASGPGLTGGPITTSGTLSIASAACGAGQAAVALPLTCLPFATLGANTFAGTQTISSGDVAINNGDLDLPGTTGVTGGVINLGGTPFIHECCNTGSGYTNTFVGLSAGNFSTTGVGNTAAGSSALMSNATGNDNTAIGIQALNFNTAGSFNTALGNNALFKNTAGNGNVGIGQGALSSNTTGGENSATGALTLENNTTGGANTATGDQALYGNTTGSNNTGAGFDALVSNTAGNNNSAFGTGALGNTNPSDGGVIQGNNNTAMGASAGATNVTGSNDSFLGYASDASVNSLTNGTAIGAYAVVGESNALVLGGTGANAVNVGIGTSTPSQVLEVVGGNVKITTSGNGLIFPDGSMQTTAGGGGLTSISAGAGLTASPSNPITSTGTLSIDTTKVPTLAATSNTFTGSITAASFSGAGSGLTNVNAATLGGFAASAFQPAGSYATLGANNFTGNQNITGAISAVPASGLTAVGGAATGGATGVIGTSDSSTGVFGSSTSGNGVYGETSSTSGGVGVFGFNTAGGKGVVAEANGSGDAVYASGASPGYAGYFSGNIDVTGSITAGTKDFKIDHPRDPADHYLYHSSVESSEMMNIYTGNVMLDANGEAMVELPDWFEALNRDFRYQLTAIGAPAPGLYIAEEIANQHFKIAGGKPGMKVSWQVTGVRQDAYANAHPLQVDVEKPANERGYYIHPELYGAPPEKSIDWARDPALMQRLKAERDKAPAPGKRQ